MTNLLQLSADVIDGRVGTDEVGPLNRINFQLSELADDVAMVEAFSHSILFKTGEGLVVFDTSNLQGSGRVVDAVRNWSKTHFMVGLYAVAWTAPSATFLRAGHGATRVVGMASAAASDTTMAIA